LKKLLYAGSIDPTFIRTDKFIVQPGERKTIILDRGENVRWIGVVAGYYELKPGLVSQTFQIPTVIETIGKIRKKKIAKIEHLSINLFFGSNTIRKDGAF
jgi:predicted component of type VI protein secretion system